jgi:hypothetical protein
VRNAGRGIWPAVRDPHASDDRHRRRTDAGVFLWHVVFGGHRPALCGGAEYGIPASIVPATNNVGINATALPTILTLTLDTPIEFVPDSLTPYLKYGVLQRVFSVDGEMKSLAMARYCGARFLEGRNLVHAILGEPQEGANG